MIRCEWIVCERSPRWAPALRAAIHRAANSSMDRSPTRKQGRVGVIPHNALACASGFNQDSSLESQVSLYEVRSLAELSGKIEHHAGSLALVEITATNLDATLTWLASNSRNGTGCRAVAVVDDGRNLPTVAAALREAGAIAVADSPRRLQSAIRIGLAHAKAAHHSKSAKPQVGQSFEAWARSLLPWQAAR
jgi:hypothetical protein